MAATVEVTLCSCGVKLGESLPAPGLGGEGVGYGLVVGFDDGFWCGCWEPGSMRYVPALWKGEGVGVLLGWDCGRLPVVEG